MGVVLTMVEDSVDQMARSLKRIEQLLAEQSGANVDVDVDGDDESVSRYFSSGPRKVAVDKTGNQWEKVTFGLTAATVNIRTDDDIVVSFNRPARNRGSHIKVRATESPFTIGGDPSIGADRIWIQKADSAASTPGVQLLAYR